MDYPRIVVGKRAKIKVLNGYLWIYRGEIVKLEEKIEPGPVVVEDQRGKFLGTGDYSPESQIAVRVFTRKKDIIDKDFIKNRIKNSYELRKKVYPDQDSFRVVFGEGDLLPGLVIDKFSACIVIQPLTAAMDKRKELLAEICTEIFNPAIIVDRSDNPSRRHEGLPLYKKIIYSANGQSPEKILIKEGGVMLYVDPLKGEKTGYFFDQRDNRAYLKYFAEGSNILDAFCYTGGFTLHSLEYGARQVTSVDISEYATGELIENLKLNNFEGRARVVNDNAFDFLRNESEKGAIYDVVVLDPPAFTKSKETVASAYRGYKEINLRALKLLKPGSVLFTFSCSYHFSLDDFLSMLVDAASDLKRTIQIVKILGQSRDHPILLSMPETKYLKGVIARLVD